VLDREGIRESRYEDTEHYAVTRAFLHNPAGMLGALLADIERGNGDDD
jgi:predicted ATPase